MRVVHVSTYDRANGAALAAYRLHQGLLSLGCDSKMFVSAIDSDEDDPTVQCFVPPSHLRIRLRRRLRRLQIARSFGSYRDARRSGLEAFSDDRGPHGAELVNQLPPCDIINVHMMYNFVDYRDFFASAPRRAPIVRTLHDMSFFTGGCHYDAGCGKHTEHCGACPRLGSSKERDLAYDIWERKSLAFRNVRPNRLFLVTASDWLAREAKRSALLRDFPITVIPHAIDTDVFSPRDRSFARSVLSIPADASVILFVAEPVTRINKGFAHLAQALGALDHTTNLLLLSVGSGTPPAKVAIPHQHLGHIGDVRLLSIIYSAADIFVIPSFQEAFGLTALEATACGTPVVGSDVGGISQTVRPGVTGLLVPPKDVAALRSAILDLLQNPVRRAQMAANCRRIAMEEYASKVQAQRYIELYQTILAGGTPPARYGAPVPAQKSDVQTELMARPANNHVARQRA